MLLSHTVVFLLGAAAVKLYDRDEMNSYRGAYEKPMQRFRRWTGNAAMGTLALGSLWVAMKVVSRVDDRKGTASSSGSDGCCNGVGGAIESK